MGHTQIDYTAAYTTMESSCIMHDMKTGGCSSSIHYPVNHPARCTAYFVCDMRCKVVDQGRAEAHTPHPIRPLPLVNTDPAHCTDRAEVR